MNDRAMRNHLVRERPLGHAEMTRMEFIMLAAGWSTALVAVYAYIGCSAQCGRCAHTIKRIMDERPGSVHADASMH